MIVRTAVELVVTLIGVAKFVLFSDPPRELLIDIVPPTLALTYIIYCPPVLPLVKVIEVILPVNVTLKVPVENPAKLQLNVDEVNVAVESELGNVI